MFVWNTERKRLEFADTGEPVGHRTLTQARTDHLYTAVSIELVKPAIAPGVGYPDYLATIDYDIGDSNARQNEYWQRVGGHPLLGEYDE